MAIDVYVKRGVRLELQKEFKCNKLTVQRALSGKTNTELAKAIRASAIQNHGGRTERVQRVIVKSR